MALSKIRNESTDGSVAGGKVLQVQYTQFTGTNSVALSANTDVVLTDLTVNITPTSASSVIHLQAHIFGEHSDDASTPWNHVLFFYRDSTKLAHATAGSRTVGISMTTRTYHDQDHSTTPEIARYDYFDTPATTSQITYKCGIVASTAETFYINRTVSDTNVNSRERGISFISATEIAG
jgi:hypothetical protein